MRRISGHFEWDDDDLTPGQKREGGLHQNLYDSDGKLKGNARFIPHDGSTPDTVVTDRVYLTLDERRRLQERGAREQFINGLVAELIDRGLAAAKPVAERWWRETAVPAVKARRTKMLEQRAPRRERKAHKPAEAAVTETAVTEPAQGLAEHSEQNGPAMSRAEAQSRLLAALAARAYSEEQMRLVAEACIVDGDGEPTRSLAELQPEQVRAAIEAMASNPALLGEDNLAQLASILARHVVRDQVEPRRRDVAPEHRRMTASSASASRNR